MVTVLIPSVMRELTGGRDRVEVDGSTLRQVVNALEAEHPGTKALIIDSGMIRPEISIAVNGDIISSGLVEPVPADAEVVIVSAISGGGR